MSIVKEINSGTLSINVDTLHPEWNSIDDLLGFASRMNAKRGFLFVSKILGKHIPVKPSEMRRSYDLMAEMLGPKRNSTLVVGMAETATGMGAGIADSLSRLADSGDVYFQHTTRHLVDQPEWFRLSEDHSHAVSHIVYEPAELKVKIENCRRLVLADDEISTGKTLLRLAQGYLTKIEKIERIDILALVSWLDDEKTHWFMTELESFCQNNSIEMPEVDFHSFMRGSFEFTKSPEFQIDLPEGTDKGIATEGSTMELGRCGLKMPLTPSPLGISMYNAEEPMVIVGTGEHLYEPFLIAEAIEKTGVDGVFQSTTRSPVYQDGVVIQSVLELPFQREEQEPVKHFIYNLDNTYRSAELMVENTIHMNWFQPVTETKSEKAA